MGGDRGSANNAKLLNASTSNGGPKTMSPKAQNPDEDLKSSETKGAHTPPAAADAGPPSVSPKKRRKVNHGMRVPYLTLHYTQQLSIGVYQTDLPASVQLVCTVDVR